MKKRILSVILSLTSVIAAVMRPGDNGWYIPEPRSFLLLPAFLVTAYALEHILQMKNTRQKVFSVIPALVLSLCHLLGSVLTEKGTALWLLKDLPTLASALFCLAGYGILLFTVIFYLFHYLTNHTPTGEEHFSRISFPVLWLILAAAWLPWLLNQYPGVMTADTTDQLEMALGIEALNNHHPVFYTLLLRVFLKLGAVLDPADPNQTGAALFTIAQFLSMSAVCAKVLKMIFTEECCSRTVKVCALLYFLICPVHPLYSVTMWKDVPFAVCILIFTALIYCELKQHKSRYVIGIAVSGILLTLFRHNGIYMILLSFPFIFITFKNSRKPVAMAFAVIILFFFGWNRLLITNTLRIPSGRTSEAFSIPLQQIALTAKRQHGAMSSEMLEELQSYFEISEIWEHYTYRISDPVKNNFSETRYRSDPAAFWRFWLKLGTTYPQDYIDSLLLHTYGYWYPETPHWVFITGIDDNGLFGIRMDPKLDTTWIRSAVRWLSDSGYDRIPVLSLLFSPGACFWLLLITFFGCLCRRSGSGFLYIPLFILWLTALASPVNCEFRYVYPLFLCLPVIFTAETSVSAALPTSE